MARFFLLLFLCLLMLAAVYRLDNRGMIPSDLPRMPYLQQVSGSSAIIAWRMVDGKNEKLKPLVSWRIEPPKDSSNPPAWNLITESEAISMVPGFLDYSVQISGLPEHSLIEYTVTIDGNSIGEGTFLSAMRKESDETMRIWVLGDSGTGKSAQFNVLSEMESHLNTLGPDGRIDLMLHVGDMAYSHGTNGEFTARFFRPYSHLLSEFPCWPAIGNHEVKSSSVETESGPYFDAYLLPRNGESGGYPSGTEAYYSFDNGPVHFISIDSSGAKITAESPMVEWLKKDLAQQDKKWCIVFMHHPPYSLGTHTSEDINDSYGRLVAVRELLLPILEGGGVDLFLAGHSHCYERSSLIKGVYGYGESPNFGIPNRETLRSDGKILSENAAQYDLGTEGGTLYVVVGHGGASSRVNGKHPVMEVADPRHGSVLLTIDKNNLVLENIVVGQGVTDTVKLTQPTP